MIHRYVSLNVYNELRFTITYRFFNLFPVPSAQSPQTRKNQACSLLRRLCKDYLKHKLPSRDDLNRLHSYSDVLDVETVMNLTQEVGDLTGVELRNSKVIFQDFAEPPHDDLVNAFNWMFDSQVNPGPPPDNPFHSHGTKSTKPFFL